MSGHKSALTGSATLADVARHAGVSRATASKALNGRFDVSVGTRERVQAAARELSFSPNAIARSLSDGRTHSVGIITGDIAGRFAPAIMRGAEDALGAERSSVFLCNTRNDPASESHHIGALLTRKVEGLIVIGRDPEFRSPLADPPGVPVIYALAPSTDPADVSVVPDNIGAGRLAVEHLLEQGRRRLAYLGGPESSQAARDRAAGMISALKSAGLDPVGGGPAFGDWLERWGWDATLRLLHNGHIVDGLICGNDQIARGAIDALHSRGVGSPADTAVVGFDNWEVLSAHGRHPITSIDMNLEGIGEFAARYLLGGLNGPVATGIVKYPCKLIVRESSNR